MPRGGRPRKHDPVADIISRHIRYGEDVLAKNLISESGTEILDGDSRTPLILATANARSDLVNWLIANEANVNHQDRIGYCALHFAAQNKLTTIARMLLNAGALTELRDLYGNTPLWTAAYNPKGDFGVLQLLLAHGASLDNTNNAGKTCRDMAMAYFPNELANLIQSSA